LACRGSLKMDVVFFLLPPPHPPFHPYMVIELKEQRASCIAHCYRLIIVFLHFCVIAGDFVAPESGLWFSNRIKI
jgi:hypothetical protein